MTRAYVCKKISEYPPPPLGFTYPIQNMRGSRGGQGVRTPLKIAKNRIFYQYRSGSPEQSQSYQASIQCWAVIGTPAKRHLMAFSWRVDDARPAYSGTWILPNHHPPSPPKKKTKKKLCQSWTPSDKTFWISACKT